MKKETVLFSLLSVFITLFFCGSKTVSAAEKTYDIGTDVTFAPFEFQNDDNEYEGIDIDILNAIAEDQGFKINL
ncbi:MAG: transporter substrate-binding domain-containing protein, partial [Bacillus sp. (in: Bacteria)]|nr:transporter substrate-binding domain-containing protein [Bacillus sp. (in: firmicutes)]